MNIVEKLWEKAKAAETPEEGNAYLIALLYVEEYLKEKEDK